MLSLIVVFPFLLSTGLSQAIIPREYLESISDGDEDRCEAIIKRIVLEDRATVADDTPGRLHSTWLSQECEVRAGPEYVIRKYTFFTNGTFLLLRHHYAEESCSVATHTVVARGAIEILSPSVLILGASEARSRLDTVHLVPLNRQVAQKFGRKFNSSCGSRLKWRPYNLHLIYERPSYFASSVFSLHGPSYNSLHGYSPLRKGRGIDCLEALGIEFNELKLLRVQKKRVETGSFHSARESRVELLLGRSGRGPYSGRIHRPTALQATPLLRIDTTVGCPICGSVSRGTEYSPPLLHEAAALPALIGGLWLSSRCESVEGGFWSRRLFEIYAGDKFWRGRWDYYADSKCSTFLYAVSAGGTYAQRVARWKRNDSSSPVDAPNAVSRIGRRERSDGKARGTESNIYRHILRNSEASMARSFAAMLRGNRKDTVASEGREDSSMSRRRTATPSGTTELELRVAESLLIPGNRMISVRCGVDQTTGVPLRSWPRNCVPRAIEAPSILSLRAKLTVNWSGQYALLLGSRNDNIWDAPLRRCSAIPTFSDHASKVPPPFLPSPNGLTSSSSTASYSLTSAATSSSTSSPSTISVSSVISLSIIFLDLPTVLSSYFLHLISEATSRNLDSLHGLSSL